MLQKLKNLYHLFQAVLANLYYGFPSRRLKVIGVTGTDGKTTTTHLIYHILKSAGKKVSMVSSVYAKVGEKEFDIGFHVTTPDVFPLQKLLSESVKNKDEYFILETTSHALYQNRVFGIQFEVGVLTNVTHEHLDMHHTLDEYTKIKSLLLKQAKFAVANADDQSFNRLKRILKNKKVISYNSKDFKIIKDLSNLTDFNKYNYLAAYTVCNQLGLIKNNIIAAMKTFKLPQGRMELVYDKEFKVIIDFAHTPNAFENVLPEIRKLYLKKNGRLIHIFGAAGLRDASKRPLMGKASNQYADVIILTEEDYRTEDPQVICRSIAQGITNRPVFTIIDRKKAIRKAMEMVKKNDVILLTGKSHEKSLCRGKIEYPWDEQKTVMQALDKLT